MNHHHTARKLWQIYEGFLNWTLLQIVTISPVSSSHKMQAVNYLYDKYGSLISLMSSCPKIKDSERTNFHSKS